MPRGRTAALVLALFTLAVLAWWLLHSGGGLAGGGGGAPGGIDALVEEASPFDGRPAVEAATASDGRTALAPPTSASLETDDGSPASVPVAHLLIEAVDVEAGGPAVDVDVRLRDYSKGWPWPDLARGKTGADGRLRLEMPAGRQLALQLDAGPDRMPIFRLLEPVEAEQELLVNVRLHPMPSFAATVVVVDESGDAVPGVRIAPRREGVFDPLSTGADGRAALPRVTGTWGTFLWVTKDGYAKTFAVLLSDQPELRVVLRAGAVLTGVVRFADGQPAAGAHLELRAPAGMMRSPVDPSPEIWQATADQQGLFRIPGLARESSLWLLAESGDASHAEALEALPAGETRLDLVLYPRPVLRGTVVDATGRPVAVELDLQPLPLAGTEPEAWRSGPPHLELERRHASTNEQGRFVFGPEARLHPGTWQVGLAGSLDRSSRPGAEAGPSYAWLPAMAELEIAPGQAEAEVLLTVSGGLSLRGFLLGPDRQPLTRGTVRAYAEDRELHSHVETQALGADGSFVLEPLAPGSYAVRGGDPERGLVAELDGVAAGSEGVILVCRRPVRLRGRVVDERGPGSLRRGVRLRRARGAERPLRGAGRRRRLLQPRSLRARDPQPSGLHRRRAGGGPARRGGAGRGRPGGDPAAGAGRQGQDRAAGTAG